MYKLIEGVLSVSARFSPRYRPCHVVDTTSRTSYILAVWLHVTLLEVGGKPVHVLKKQVTLATSSSSSYSGELLGGIWGVSFGAGSLLAHSSHLLLFIFIVHTQSKDVFVIFVVLCVRLYSYCISFGTVFTFTCTSDICIKLLLTYLLTYLLIIITSSSSKVHILKLIITSSCLHCFNTMAGRLAKFLGPHFLNFLGES